MNDNICFLLYADDIVFVAENENDMQHVLDILWMWCEKWRINLNISNSNVIYAFQERSDSVINIYFIKTTNVGVGLNPTSDTM